MNQDLVPLTVTQLNRQVRTWLEHDLGIIAVSGEMSNISKPASGHLYFTLKDSQAQLRCVFFRNYHSQASQLLSAGQQVLATGILSLYEARGDYQLIVHNLVPSGIGELYQQFEQLKQKLEALGLFDVKRKRAIRRFPKIIAIVTSESAAALQDILSTLGRRFPLSDIHIYPSEVQGKNAAAQLRRAIIQANLDNKADVILLARGGGSMEDLWPFNDEALAYAISQSTIPIVSGVGHETDFSIADFVADLRAATPTAAAEAVSPHKNDLLQLIASLEDRLTTAICKMLQQHRMVLSHYLAKLSSPQDLIYKHWQTLDYLERQLRQQSIHLLSKKRHQLQMALTILKAKNPKFLLPPYQMHLHFLQQQLQHLIHKKLEDCKRLFTNQLGCLHALSPLATFERGYAIASTSDDETIIYDAKQVNLGDSIRLQLAKGRLTCQVTDKEED